MSKLSDRLMDYAKRLHNGEMLEATGLASDLEDAAEKVRDFDELMEVEDDKS